MQSDRAFPLFQQAAVDNEMDLFLLRHTSIALVRATHCANHSARNAEHLIEHNVLRVAGIGEPYLLVSHSLDGLLVRAFAFLESHVLFGSGPFVV